MGQARVQPGVPAGGEFTATLHGESPVALGAPVTAPQGPGLHGHVPAPLASQKYLDGTRIPAGASFDEAYEEFFKPLEDYEASHGPWQNTRPPSEEKLRDLAGLAHVELGDVAGTVIDVDEATGDPVIAVMTRNGGSWRRECTADTDTDCGACNACIQDAISGVPTHLRDEDDAADDECVTSYFTPLDPAAAKRYLEDEKTRRSLNHRLHARTAVEDGSQPPWAILSPVRTGAERQAILRGLVTARTQASQIRHSLAYADGLLAAVAADAPLPKAPTYENAPQGIHRYGIYSESAAEYAAKAAASRNAQAALQAEASGSMPPAISALVATEMARLEKAAAADEEHSATSLATVVEAKENIRDWAARRKSAGAERSAAVDGREDELAAFEWSSSWPGDPKDCPPRPAAG